MFIKKLKNMMNDFWNLDESNDKNDTMPDAIEPNTKTKDLIEYLDKVEALLDVLSVYKNTFNIELKGDNKYLQKAAQDILLSNEDILWTNEFLRQALDQELIELRSGNFDRTKTINFTVSKKELESVLSYAGNVAICMFILDKDGEDIYILSERLDKIISIIYG